MLFRPLQKEVDRALIPTRVKALEGRAVDVSMGPFHTAVLRETGQVCREGLDLVILLLMPFYIVILIKFIIHELPNVLILDNFLIRE